MFPVPVSRARFRVLFIAALFALASLPTLVSGFTLGGLGLLLMAAGLAVRFPMSGLCAQMGSVAYLGLTMVALFAPERLGPSGLWDPDPWRRVSAWLCLAAALMTLRWLDVETFRSTYASEGLPLAIPHPQARAPG